MTSLQSTLGDDDVATRLAAGQREISIAEFFEKNKHMLGFDSGARALVTAIKEAVDNALDATEEAGHLPDIYVEIEEAGEYYRVIVEDNGPGITKEQIPKVFGKLLYGSRFHAREQSRGQQGIGISAAVLYSQLTSGKAAAITSRTKSASEAEYFELIIDTDTNEPEIEVEETTTWDRPHGTRIELEMEANMRARTQLHDYIKHTAVVNPHARIEFHEPRESVKFERATDELPAETEEIRPHPHGVELGTVIKMLGATNSHSLSGFLQEEFTRVGQKTAADILDAFRDVHFGREMGWRPPGAHEERDVASAVEEAVANKGREATAAFAAAVDEATSARERVAYSDLVEIVAEAAETAESEHGTGFGATVRENAVEAAWEVITTERAADLYGLVDGVTSNQKDETTVRRLADRIAAKFESEAGERDRATHRALAGFVDRAAAMTEEREEVTVGETARENVVEAIWTVMRTVPDDVPLVREVADDRDTASSFVEAMRTVDVMSPPTNCLAPITAELLEAGLRKEYDADFYAAATRSAGVHGGDPFVVEAGIAYGGELEAEGAIDVLRFANRVPLVYQRGACATTDVVKRIGWRNYGLNQPGGSGTPQGPAVVMVHVASTNVPFTSESKDAIANVPEIEDEIELAIREAARELKRYLNKRQSLEKRQRKQSALATILPEMAEKVAEVTEREPPNIDGALARIMNNVRVGREVEEGTVRIVVKNYSGTTEEPEITDIVSVEPGNLSNGAQVVEMDGEWYVQWSPSIPSGETAVLEYAVGDGAEYDLAVRGVAAEKLTVIE
jgi:DNA topoisomerase VI subunit B